MIITVKIQYILEHDEYTFNEFCDRFTKYFNQPQHKGFSQMANIVYSQTEDLHALSDSIL